MPLTVGEKLGPYEIISIIGKGGMGEVYRARDTRLNRDVAIKVSAAQFTERFEREARAVAALNHPNICTLYDVGPNYLVMELVEGESPKGPIPLNEALLIARQIADALEAAHDKGITHRDLKPGNIKIKSDGTVKVLDFGLAKITPAEPGAASENSPTLSMAATQAGMILGTAAYMPPEQARGKPVDKRADIWAFGVVLYEILTGERLFHGEDITDTLASVVKDKPDLSRVPFPVRRLLARCLEKDPAKRLRDIGDAWGLLDEEPVAEPGAAQVGNTTNKWIWPSAAIAAMGAALVLAFLHFRETALPEQELRHTIPAPENSIVQFFAISPNGRYVVMSATVNGKNQLWLRATDALQAHPMPGTDFGALPFWSPDSRYIGFFAEGKLKKIAASGGPAQTLCDSPNARGGSWSRDNIILFSEGNGPVIQRVSEAGGVPTDVVKSSGSNRFPVFLPDGRRFFYLAMGESPEKNGIYIRSLDGKENRRVLADQSSVVYAPAASGRVGHLLFMRQNSLMAQPFDSGTLQTAGDLFPVADGLSFGSFSNLAPVSVSENGVLLFASSGVAVSQIAWLDRAGKQLSKVDDPGSVEGPAISPDEKWIAFQRDSVNGNSDLWLRDLARGTNTRFTSDASINLGPVWSPKGDHIIFRSNRGGKNGDLYQKSASGSAQEELLLASPNWKTADQWSKDGRFLVYSENGQKTKWDLFVLPMGQDAGGDRKPNVFLQTEFNEEYGQLSPDGHWMAYTSDRSGSNEVYVRPFPIGEGEWKISLSGGEQPRWCCDGKELLFVAADGKMTAVPVKASPGPKPSLDPGAPAPLFEAHIVQSLISREFQYDVTADGKHFLINTAGAASSTPPLTVIVNWNTASAK